MITHKKWVRLGLGETIIYNKIDNVFTAWACSQVVKKTKKKNLKKPKPLRVMTGGRLRGFLSEWSHDGLASGAKSRRVTAPNTSRVTQGKYGREKKNPRLFCPTFTVK